MQVHMYENFSVITALLILQLCRDDQNASRETHYYYSFQSPGDDGEAKRILCNVLEFNFEI